MSRNFPPNSQHYFQQPAGQMATCAAIGDDDPIVPSYCRMRPVDIRPPHGCNVLVSGRRRSHACLFLVTTIISCFCCLLKSNDANKQLGNIKVDLQSQYNRQCTGSSLQVTAEQRPKEWSVDALYQRSANVLIVVAAQFPRFGLAT